MASERTVQFMIEREGSYEEYIPSVRVKLPDGQRRNVDLLHLESIKGRTIILFCV